MKPMFLNARTTIPKIYRTAQRSTLNQLKCSRAASSLSHKRPTQTQEKRKLIFDNRSPSLQDFLAQANAAQPLEPLSGAAVSPDQVPYLNVIGPSLDRGRKFYIEVYGCQMNVNDTEILNSILTNSGYVRTSTIEDANVVFLVTCAIRENAESRIWERLKFLRHYRTKVNKETPPMVGVLGCMAERLKSKLLEQDRLVDIVCGPDAYRSIPHLISLAETKDGVANVMLSADETYADVMPMRLDKNSVSGWVSVMRGCNNMCSFCIVPFTRGNERSRPIETILNEVRYLSEQGVKEVTLLGQNVNSYRDTSETTVYGTDIGTQLSNSGFNTIYKRKAGGVRFTELLDRVSLINPEMRIRFTSPHPKDFPVDLLHLISERPNICNSVHLPIQSGSTSMIGRMRRGYSREAYLELVDTMRKIIPNVWISSDFIVGFCDETEQEHRDTVTLMEEVGYDMAFMFAYSMREKTHAHRKYVDNVPEDVKARRLNEIIQTFHKVAQAKTKLMIGSKQHVLVESDVPKVKNGVTSLFSGHTDGGHKVFLEGDVSGIQKGDYVTIKVRDASSVSLRGEVLKKQTIGEFACSP
ncbi:tRNA-I(6)A37 thiotransferase enzyme MiaB [Umbelopsis sp. PMI_123]|nr:tRNA-I(6)A37 thiotransferase enzyme MiaB [Umbelopsis sp. PMI_123]